MTTETVSELVCDDDLRSRAAELERKLAEVTLERDQLKERHQRLRRVVDTASVGIAFFAADGTVTHANASLLDMLGIARAAEDERQTFDWRQLKPDENSAQWALAWNDLRALGRVGPFETQMLHSSGRMVPLLASAFVIDEERRDHVAFLVDLTAQRSAETSLADSVTRQRFALTSAKLGSWELAMDGLVFETDARHDEIFGLHAHRGRFSYAEFLDHVLPEDRDAVDRKLRRALKNTSDLAFECRIRRGDGGVSWVEVHGSCRAGDDVSQPRRMIGTLADITARKRAEQALVESEERYRIMGETLPYGAWLADPEGRCEYVSASFMELVGLELEELRGLGWTDTLVAEEASATIEAWNACIATGTPWERELRVRARDGTQRTVLSRGLPVRDKNGRVTCWVGLHLDISERKRMEDELRESRAALEQQMRRLEAVDQRKDEFLAILGHELRNPLAAIGNGVHLINRGIADPERQRWTTTMLAEQVRQLTRIVDDLLDVTRISRGKVQIKKSRVSLRQTLERAIEAARPVLDERQHTLEVELKQHDLYIDADETRIRQVIVNLVTNAAKYTPPAGRLRVTLDVVEGQSRLVVEDNGAGIAPENLERIFEPFTQVRGSSIAGGGLGIGLTIVRQLVGLHGGSISVKSAGLGRGSTFTVTLPLARGVVEPHLSGEARAIHSIAGSLRVLVIDDNADAAVALSLLLGAVDCTVKTAYTGGAGIEKAKELIPDVVLCDIGLPDVTGFEVAKALRGHEATRSAMLVAVTGFGHEDVVRRVRESGFDLHLLKPVDPDVLFDLLAGARRSSAAPSEGQR